MNDLYVIVMAGGSGTRFWPRSRKDRPKQALAFGPGGTLIQETLARIPASVTRDRVLLVTLADQAELLREQTGLDPRNVLREPMGRDTAACIALAAAEVHRRDPDGIMAVLAADHVIHATSRFAATIEHAARLARDRGAIVTLGITPTIAATGFGYIERGAEIEGHVFDVVHFHEKPQRDRAEAFFASGNFLWNSGIFIWRASTIRAAIARCLPALHAAIAEIESWLGTPRQDEAIAKAYAALEKISIDKGVLEKTDGRLVIAADFDWDDVGTLSALARHNAADERRNTLLGDVVHLETENCIVDNRDDGIVALLGVNDLIVVRTPDAVLVARRSDAERIKDLVEKLRASGKDRYL